FYESNRAELLSEEVKQYKSASYTGTPELRKNPQPCFRQFAFLKEDEPINKTYNLYDLENGDGDNLNYDFNSQLKMIELDALIDEVLSAKEAFMKRQI
ncbi:MAG: hypothetical protein AAF466_09040, partial [Bacteroidota bacterium]